MSAMWTYLNDRLVPAEQAMVPVTDRGFLYGDGLFETMAVYAGAVFRLDQHVHRLTQGASALSIPVPEGIGGRIMSTLHGNGLADGLLRLALTRGSGQRGLAVGACRSPTLVIQCFPCPPARTPLRRRGATVAIARTRRLPPECLPSVCKSANYLNNILAFQEAEAVGADEALMLASRGDDMVEGTVSNILFVRDGALLTPALDSGVMPGITRACVLECAAALGIACNEQGLPVASLPTFQEAFYTNTGVGIMPVSRIGEQAFQVPGAVTERLVDALGEMIAREAGPAWNAGPATRRQAAPDHAAHSRPALTSA